MLYGFLIMNSTYFYHSRFSRCSPPFWNGQRLSHLGNSCIKIFYELPSGKYHMSGCSRAFSTLAFGIYMNAHMNARSLKCWCGAKRQHSNLKNEAKNCNTPQIRLREVPKGSKYPHMRFHSINSCFYRLVPWTFIVFFDRFGVPDNCEGGEYFFLTR